MATLMQVWVCLETNPTICWSLPSACSYCKRQSHFVYAYPSICPGGDGSAEVLAKGTQPKGGHVPQ